MKFWERVLVWGVVIVAGVGLLLALLSIRSAPESFTYGSSFNTLYAQELGLDYKEVYRAMLEDLGVRHLRLSAHWTLVEPEQDVFNFEELDYQIALAEEYGASVILGVGRRLPRWPECHIPHWAKELSWEEQQSEIRAMITEVVTRYKDRNVIWYWQVENEPFLTVFAQEECGELDKDFLEEEIQLVKELDQTRPVIVTDSGNLGTWFGAYRLGDVFGTSAYVYFWNEDVGPFKSLLPPAYYRIKYNLMRTLYGEKKSFLIELSAEPWLLQPVVDTPIETQLERMDIKKFREIVQFAQGTGFDTQYLWGAEWWYWLTLNGDDSFWEYGKTLFSTERF